MGRLFKGIGVSADILNVNEGVVKEKSEDYLCLEGFERKTGDESTNVEAKKVPKYF